MPTVYVAGGFVHKGPVRELQRALKGRGYTVTHDWTTVEHDDGSSASPERLREFSRFDMDGVRTADFVAVVFNDADYPYRGTMAEIGGAVALVKPVLIWDTLPETAEIWKVPFVHDRVVRRFRTIDELVTAAGELAAETACAERC